MKKVLFALLLFFTPLQSFAALTLDASATANTVSGSTCVVTLTTPSTNDVVYILSKAAAASNPPSVSSISDTAGLTWTFRKQVAGGSTLNTNSEGWYAVSSGTLSSDAITVHYASTPTACRLEAIAVNGANTSSPFDPNASIPNGHANANTATTSNSVTISTTNPHDFLIAFGYVVTSLGTVTPPTGFTNLLLTAANSIDYDIVSSTQSSVTETYSWTGGSQVNGMIFDAITADSSATPAQNNFWHGQ